MLTFYSNKTTTFGDLIAEQHENVFKLYNKTLLVKKRDFYSVYKRDNYSVKVT